jgi:hypothetical protein
MLYTMLNLICFLACIFAAVGAARDAKIGFVGYALAAAIGLALGGGSTWAMINVGDRVAAAVEALPEARRELYLRVFYLAAPLWILVAMFIADRVTSAAMRLTL